MKIGEVNSLQVSRTSVHGLYLRDHAGEEVLLPRRYLEGDEKEGDEIQVFVYNDSEDRLVATTETPKIMLNEFAPLKVVDVSGHGVFLDWGLKKDLLVPFKEQDKKMRVGNIYVVRMYLDEETDRLVATSKLRNFLSNDKLAIKELDEVDLLVFNRSELGFDVIINNKHAGLVYENEVFTPLEIGDRLKGYIRRLRPDGKIDVSLQPPMAEHLKNCSEHILEVLETRGGVLNLSDKSSPDEIYATLHISKKSFKKAIGNLYRERKIKILPDRISLK